MTHQGKITQRQHKQSKPVRAFKQERTINNTTQALTIKEIHVSCLFHLICERNKLSVWIWILKALICLALHVFDNIWRHTLALVCNYAWSANILNFWIISRNFLHPDSYSSDPQNQIMVKVFLKMNLCLPYIYVTYVVIPYLQQK